MVNQHSHQPHPAQPGKEINMDQYLTLSQTTCEYYQDGVEYNVHYLLVRPGYSAQYFNVGGGTHPSVERAKLVSDELPA